MTRCSRFRLAAAGALLSLLAWSAPTLAQGSWATSHCRGVTTRNDDASWPPTPSWDGLGVSDDPNVAGREHELSGDGWAGECFEVTLCRPRVMRFRINDLDFRPGHNYELWIDGQKIGTTPPLGNWGYKVCKLGHYGQPSNGDWKIGFGTTGQGVDVQLPHTDGQLHKLRVRFAGFDGHTPSAIHDSCMTNPNCAIKWDWVTPKVVAKGHLVYRDSLVSAETAMRSVILTLFDRNADGSIRRLLDGSTDANGLFQFPCIDNLDDDGSQLDLMVRAWFVSDSTAFEQPFTDPPIIKPVRMLNRNGDLWSFDSPIKMDCTGDPDHSVLDFGTVKPAANDYSHNSALHIYTTMLRGWDWVHDRTDFHDADKGIMGFTTVTWDWEYQDPQSQGSNTLGTQIFISGKGDRAAGHPDEWDNDVLLHEYGHRVAFRYNFGTGAQVDHSYGSPVVDSNGHPSLTSAWEEGWCDFFSRAVLGSGPTRQNVGWDKNSTTRSKTTVNLEDGKWSVVNPGSTTQSGTANDQGATWEIPIAGALWDMYDDLSKSDNQPGALPCGEAYVEGTTKEGSFIFEACRSTDPAPVTDIFSFHHAYVHLHPDAATPLTDLFCEHGIDVTPHAPGQIGSDPPTVDAQPTLADDLLPGRPNPFRLGTTIDFSLATPARVDLHVFDVRGRLVQVLLRDQARAPGRYSVPWNGRDLAGNSVRPGVYFYRLVTDGFRAEKKLLVIP